MTFARTIVTIVNCFSSVKNGYKSDRPQQRLTMTFFQFEADFVESVRCIPMQIRMKLDTCVVKLKLSHSNQFSLQERQRLVEMSCGTEAEIAAYREYLKRLVVGKTGKLVGELAIDLHPLWLDPETVPVTIKEKAAEFDAAIAYCRSLSLMPQKLRSSFSPTTV